jgi:hypothetical protein
MNERSVLHGPAHKPWPQESSVQFLGLSETREGEKKKASAKTATKEEGCSGTLKAACH